MKGYENMYYKIRGAGFYLPDIETCRYSLHEEYLRKLINGEIFSIRNSELTEPIVMVKKKTCSELFDEILKFKTEKQLGFDVMHLPPKDYLLKMLWVLNKAHKFF